MLIFRVFYRNTRPTLFLTTPLRICPPMPPMPPHPELSWLAHFCLASRSLYCKCVQNAKYAQGIHDLRVSESYRVRDVEHKREHDDRDKSMTPSAGRHPRSDRDTYEALSFRMDTMRSANHKAGKVYRAICNQAVINSQFVA